jgi:large subunit ribosomal protein L24
VEGVNMVKRATKGKGFVEKQLSLHISNVMFYSQDLKAPSRLGITHKEGKKVRVLKKNGKAID